MNSTDEEVVELLTSNENTERSIKYEIIQKGNIMKSVTRIIPYHDSLKLLEEAGIELSEDQIERIRDDDYTNALEEDHSKLMVENMALKEELRDIKERLAELDPIFGDIYYSSDHGHEMNFR